MGTPTKVHGGKGQRANAFNHFAAEIAQVSSFTTAASVRASTSIASLSQVGTFAPRPLKNTNFPLA